MEKEYKNKTLSEVDMLSSEILRMAGDTKVFIFKGDLGSGKTTLVRQMVKRLGVKEAVSSPTFSIVNIYEDRIYHFDLYRLKRVEELEDIGFFEYLESGHVCLIEWPDLAEPYLDMPYLEIILSINEDNSRNVVILSYAD